MSRRDFRTPSSIPTASIGRCIVVPNDAAWLGLLNAALLMLTEQWRYDQVETTDLTPEETAAVWYDIYVSTLTSNCEDCPDMNCNDVLECMLPYLEASFYEDADIRIDPITSKPQVSYDGGTTWSDIPQSGNGTINAPQPQPTSGANNAAKICLAATRATLVIAEFYKQTFGAFTADVMNALGTANTFLQDVKMILFNAIYSPYDGVLEAAGFLTQDFETNYTAGELSAQNLEDLLCLLVNNAAVDSNGVVTFDHGAVRDNVIADVGINPGTALWFLLGNMQEAGLNAAGSVRITDDPLDCTHCEPYGWYALGGNGKKDSYSIPYPQGSSSACLNIAGAAYDVGLDAWIEAKCINGPDYHTNYDVIIPFGEILHVKEIRVLRVNTNPNYRQNRVVIYRDNAQIYLFDNSSEYASGGVWETYTVDVFSDEIRFNARGLDPGGPYREVRLLAVELTIEP